MLIALSAVALTAGGCMVGPKYARPPVEQPASFKAPAPNGAGDTVPDEWWRLYRDLDLDELILTANVSNQTLRQAVARVDEARARSPASRRAIGTRRFLLIQS